MADVEALYKSYGVLADAGEKVNEHNSEYEAIIQGTKGSTSAKRLAADFICKFFTQFPDMADQAIEAQLDLCEDEDAMVRQAAIKALPMLCRDGSDNSQIGDVLAQLLQSDSAIEAKVVRNAMVTLLRKDTKSALAGLFYQIVSAEVLAKERAVSFLGTTVVDMLPQIAHPHPEIEEFIISEAKNTLDHVAGSQFTSVMSVLRKLKSQANLAGTQKLADILAEVAGFANEAPPTEGDALQRALTCAYEASFLCKRGAPPKVFVEYIVNTVLPILSSLPAETQLSACKALAALAHPLAMKPEDLSVLCEPTLAALMALLPEAPQPSEDDTAPAVPEISYPAVESLLFAFHQLAKKTATFLHSDEEATTRLRLLKVRLQFLGLCCQSASRDLKASEGETAKTSLKAIQNISILIKSFLKVPPAYQASITLSFVKPVVAAAAITAPTSATSSTPATAAADTTGAQKRTVPSGTDADSAKRPMTGKALREQYAAERGRNPQQEQSSSGNGSGSSWRGGRGRGRGRRGRNY